MVINILIALIFIILLGLIVWLAILTRNLIKIQRQITALSKGSEGANILEIINRHLELENEISQDITRLYDDQAITSKILKTAVKKVGIERFNAFVGGGGELSFSLALLNSFGNGVVVSCIQGRNESRVYAKPVVEGRSPQVLSKEEIKAIEKALAEEIEE